MALRRIPLTGGDYQAKWLGANAQRCLNYYAERNPEDAPFPYTYYQRPGLTQVSAPPSAGYGRMLYTDSTGQLWGVVGSTLYAISSSFLWTAVQTLTTGGPTPTSMADNGLVAIIVDGTINAYAVTLGTTTAALINAGNTGAFYAANRVDYVDTYFLFNRTGTAQFFISLSEVTLTMLTGGPYVTGTITGAGSGYTNGTYYAIPLTGGSGSGATANLTVAGTNVTNVYLVTGGASYRVGDVLSATVTGAIQSGSITATGTNCTDNTYTNVALVGGTGTGATATIVCSGGAVTTVTLTNSGLGYTAGDVLQVNAQVLGNLSSGFQWTVSAVSAAGTGFAFTVTAVGSSAFDALDIAAKTGWPDPLSTGPVVMHRELWLVGTKTTEVWYNSGAADFTFQALPGVFIEHGCIAPWSVAVQDVIIYWLSQDKQGRAIVVKGANYAAARISTHALETALQSYSTISDAVGYTWQIEGHVFYSLNFPTANATWVWDEAEQLWHEECWLDGNGNENRHRGNCYANAYGQSFCLDWQTGALYSMGGSVYTDAGAPVKYLRSFPHLQADGKRMFHSEFMLDLQAGAVATEPTTGPPRIPLPMTFVGSNGLPITWTGTTTGLSVIELEQGGYLANSNGEPIYALPAPAGPVTPLIWIADSPAPYEPQVSISWSDNRGVSYGQAVQRGVGATGQFGRYANVWRCGYARDRVYQVEHSINAPVAIQGAYISTKDATS